MTTAGSTTDLHDEAAEPRRSHGSIGVMSITPFDAGGAVDVGELERHLARFDGAGVDVYLCSQGTGEGLSLSLDDKELVYRTAHRVLGGRCEVVGAGVGLTGDTQSALAQVERLSVTGIDALQVFPPRTGALRPRDREIERYFDEVGAVAGCPVVLGENVVLVGYEMGQPLVRRILDAHPEFTGLSYTAPGGIGQLADLVRALDGRVGVRTGWLHHFANMAALGGAGVLCYDGNVAPRLCATTWTALRTGRQDGLGLLGSLYALDAVLARFGNPHSVKAALEHLGLPAGRLRRPFLGLGADEQADLVARLERLREDGDLDRWL